MKIEGEINIWSNFDSSGIEINDEELSNILLPFDGKKVKIIIEECS